MLRDVGLQVTAGTLAAVEGPNGCGKTTLLRIVAGMLEADTGTVRVCGIQHDEDGIEYRRRLGVAPAGNAGLYARLGVRAHLDFFARIALLEAEERESRVEAVMARFALHEFGAQRLDRLSMGQRQRVRLAAAFLAGAPLVLLDEPVTSLDERGTALLTDAIAEHLDAGRGAVWFGPTGVPLPVTPHVRLALG